MKFLSKLKKKLGGGEWRGAESGGLVGKGGRSDVNEVDEGECVQKTEVF